MQSMVDIDGEEGRAIVAGWDRVREQYVDVVDKVVGLVFGCGHT